MKIQEKDKNQESGEKKIEEEYWFLQEAIRPRRRGRIVRIIRRLLLLIVFAVVFGVTGAIAFHMTQNALDKREEAQERKDFFSGLEHSGDASDEDKAEADNSNSSAIHEQHWKELANVGKECNHSVVTVYAGHTESWYQRSVSQDKVQSGILFHKKGKKLYVLTSDTAIIQGKSLNVEFINQDTVRARLVKEDELLGIAVLEVKMEDVAKETRKDIRIAKLAGEELKLELNQWVFALGNADGIMYSVIPGIIVNTELSTDIPDGELGLYCTNISFNSNGDGFVADVKGRIIGMFTSAYKDISGDTNYAFIASSDIAAVVMRLVEGKSTASLGINGCDIEKEDTCGVYVQEVTFKSPAYAGGVRVADVIVEIDGYQIDSIKSLRLALLTHDPGDKVTLQVKRDNGKKVSQKELTAVLE